MFMRAQGQKGIDGLLLATLLVTASIQPTIFWARAVAPTFSAAIAPAAEKPSYAEFERLVFDYDLDVQTPRLRLQHYRDLGYEDRWLRIASSPVYNPNPDRQSLNWWRYQLLSGMNRTIGLTSGAGLYWASVLETQAWTHGSAISTCLQGGGANDNGCAAANGTVSYNVLTDPTVGPGSPGYSVVQRPYFNVAGSTEDQYLVGVTAGTVLLDPATNTLPSTCTYSATGNSGNPLMTCGNSAWTNGVINAWEFGPTGGHGATSLLLVGTNIRTSITITNSDFQADAGAIVGQGAAIFLNTSGGYSSANIDIERNTLNGSCQSTTCTLASNWAVNLDGSGARTEKLNAFLFFPQRPQTFNTGPIVTTPGDSVFENNLIYGFSYLTGATHGEFVEDISNPSPCCSLQANTKYLGNTGILPASAGATLATTVLYISGGGGLQGYTNVLLDKNVLFVNKAGGTGSPIAFTAVDVTAAYVFAFTATDNYFYAPASAPFSCGGNQSFLTSASVSSGVLTVNGITGFANGLIQNKSLWLNASGTASGDLVGTQISSTTSALSTLSGATIASGSKIVTFVSSTGTINGKNAQPIPYPGDLLVGAGVLAGTHFVSAVDSTHWNIDTDNNIPTAESMTGYRSGSSGTYNVTGGDISSQNLTAYSAFPPTPSVGNDAVMPSITMSGNIDMTSGASLNAFQQQVTASCPLPT